MSRQVSHKQILKKQSFVYMHELKCLGHDTPHYYKYTTLTQQQMKFYPFTIISFMYLSPVLNVHSVNLKYFTKSFD